MPNISFETSSWVRPIGKFNPCRYWHPMMQLWRSPKEMLFLLSPMSDLLYVATCHIDQPFLSTQLWTQPKNASLPIYTGYSPSTTLIEFVFLSSLWIVWLDFLTLTLLECFPVSNMSSVAPVRYRSSIQRVDGRIFSCRHQCWRELVFVDTRGRARPLCLGKQARPVLHSQYDERRSLWDY